MALYKESPKEKTNSPCRICWCLVSLICLALALCFAVFTTYLVMRYVPAYNRRCPSRPSATASEMLLGSSWKDPNGNHGAKESTNDTYSESISQTKNGVGDPAKSSLDSSARLRNLIQNYNLTECRLAIELSGQQWINKSQHIFNQYLKDDNKILNCTHSTPVPDMVLQKALNSYQSIKNICKIEEQVDDERKILMKLELTTKLPVLYKQRLQKCMEKPFCTPSGKTIVAAYIDHYEHIVAEVITGKSNTRGKVLSASLSREISQSSITCFANNSVYVAGIGIQNKELWKWSRGEWTRLADLPAGRLLHCVICMNNKIYVLGGTTSSQTYAFLTANRRNISEPILQYDIESNSWTNVSNLLQNVDNPHCVSHKQSIYVFGVKEKQYITSNGQYIQIYNTKTNTSSISPVELSQERYHIATVWGSKVLLLGNRGHDIYDLELNSLEKNEHYWNRGISTLRIEMGDSVAVDGDMLHSLSRVFAYNSYQVRTTLLAGNRSSHLFEEWKSISKVQNGFNIKRLLGIYLSPCSNI